MQFSLFLVAACFLGNVATGVSFTLPSQTHGKLHIGTSLTALKYPLTQVVSDIDDTLKSSGGVKIGGVALGGIDVQYARGQFYPGVFQFMWELSLYSVKLNERYFDEHLDKKKVNSLPMSKLTPPKVAVLTARAEEFKAALEIKEDSKLAVAFRQTGESSETHATKNWGVGKNEVKFEMAKHY